MTSFYILYVVFYFTRFFFSLFFYRVLRGFRDSDCLPPFFHFEGSGLFRFCRDFSFFSYFSFHSSFPKLFHKLLFFHSFFTKLPTEEIAQFLVPVGFGASSKKPKFRVRFVRLTILKQQLLSKVKWGKYQLLTSLSTTI